MKWDKPTGSVQYSTDRRFSVVKANSVNFIAYRMGVTTAEDLGTKPTADEARELCEVRECAKGQS